MRPSDALPKEALSTAAASAIGGAREELVGVALDIHAHPELNYQEHYYIIFSKNIILYNKKIYMLLHGFFKETGVPVLLNTSFNLGGEPIVESPADAVKTFTKSNIDILIMHNYYCWK